MATHTRSTRRATGASRRRRKPAGVASGLLATELTPTPPAAVVNLQQSVERDGGRSLAVYREPYGGQWVILAALPIEQVEPTPFQRNLSEMHLRRLETVIGKIGRFLDPIIAIRVERVTQTGAVYWTPNGHHRLSAMRTLGAKSIVAILVPEAAAAYQILALNTEKAHNLRERALEVIRMYKELAQLDEANEMAYALEFEEPTLITLGLCYEEQGRFGGGAYHPILKRVDQFLRQSLRTALATRQARARGVLELDAVVKERVEALKARGLSSPYLRNFVVARLNPLRFRPKEASPLSFDETLERMMSAATKFNPEKIKMDDLAKTGGIPDDA